MLVGAKIIGERGDTADDSSGGERPFTVGPVAAGTRPSDGEPAAVDLRYQGVVHPHGVALVQQLPGNVGAGEASSASGEDSSV